MRLLCVVLVALVCTVVPSYSTESKMERWYVLSTIGYGQNGYPLDLQEALDELGDEPNARHHAISTDILWSLYPIGYTDLNRNRHQR